MKLLDFGSLNIDHTYQLPHLVRPGETLASDSYHKSEGGKGFNQAVALAKAGQEVYLAGAIGQDGLFLRDYLQELGVHTEHLCVLDAPTGHAMIQLDAEGQNCIILFGGTNGMITEAMIDEVLADFGAGDYLLLQNEISHVDSIICAAHAKGMHIILNPSPMSPELLTWPLELVEWFILNEIEGADITGKTQPEEMLDELLRRYPACHVVLTLGERLVPSMPMRPQRMDSEHCVGAYGGYHGGGRHLHGLLYPCAAARRGYPASAENGGLCIGNHGQPPRRRPEHSCGGGGSSGDEGGAVRVKKLCALLLTLLLLLALPRPSRSLSRHRRGFTITVLRALWRTA